MCGGGDFSEVPPIIQPCLLIPSDALPFQLLLMIACRACHEVVTLIPGKEGLPDRTGVEGRGGGFEDHSLGEVARA